MGLKNTCPVYANSVHPRFTGGLSAESNRYLLNLEILLFSWYSKAIGFGGAEYRVSGHWRISRRETAWALKYE